MYLSMFDTNVRETDTSDHGLLLTIPYNELNNFKIEIEPSESQRGLINIECAEKTIEYQRKPTPSQYNKVQRKEVSLLWHLTSSVCSVGIIAASDGRGTPVANEISKKFPQDQFPTLSLVIVVRVTHFRIHLKPPLQFSFLRLRSNSFNSNAAKYQETQTHTKMVHKFYERGLRENSKRKNARINYSFTRVYVNNVI